MKPASKRLALYWELLKIGAVSFGIYIVWAVIAQTINYLVLPTNFWTFSIGFVAAVLSRWTRKRATKARWRHKKRYG